jgi:hypothetical protein
MAAKGSIGAERHLKDLERNGITSQPQLQFVPHPSIDLNRGAANFAKSGRSQTLKARSPFDINDMRHKICGVCSQRPKKSKKLKTTTKFYRQSDGTYRCRKCRDQ